MELPTKSPLFQSLLAAGGKVSTEIDTGIGKLVLELKISDTDTQFTVSLPDLLYYSMLILTILSFIIIRIKASWDEDRVLRDSGYTVPNPIQRVDWPILSLAGKHII